MSVWPDPDPAGTRPSFGCPAGRVAELDRLSPESRHLIIVKDRIFLFTA